MNPAKDEHLVFVYGTLKRGATNAAVMTGHRYVAEGRTVPGYRLFVVAAYPGMVKDPADRIGVAGEIWAVDSAGLRRLDAFEGVPEKLYRREPVVLQAPHDRLEVDGYLYLRTTRGRRALLDGHWPVHPPRTSFPDA